MHQSFRYGFEKIAKKEKDTDLWQGTKDTASGITMGAVGSLALPAVSGIGALMTLEQPNISDTNKVIRVFRSNNPDNNVKINRASVRENPLISLSEANYNPLTHTVNAPNSPSVMAHELGHSTAPRKKMYFNTYSGSKKLTYLLSPLAPGIVAGAKGHENIQDIATYAPLVTSIPVVAEEARASLKGLNYIRKSHGFGKALRAAVPLGFAGATYAAMPIGSMLSSKLIKDKMNNGRKD
jgi:hypothetical protein